MRIVIEIAPAAARKAFDAIEAGRFEDMDALASEAIMRLFDADDPEAEDHASSTQRPAIEGEVGSPRFRTGHSVPWVWGMVNRVFPLKLVARACANLAAGTESGGVPLHVLHREVTATAVSVGAELRAEDEALGRDRSARRSVGLPKAGQKAGSSRLRFAHHFVGRRSSDGEYSGGGFETGLLGVIDERHALIAPTKIGWDFARLANPVLDRDGKELLDSNLSEEDARCYLFRVGREVPAEADAFHAILRFLQSGSRTTHQINTEVHPCTPSDAANSVARSVRSGALGRLTDIGAVGRRTIGRGARYEIQPMGREYLASGKPRVFTK